MQVVVYYNYFSRRPIIYKLKIITRKVNSGWWQIEAQRTISSRDHIKGLAFTEQLDIQMKISYGGKIVSYHVKRNLPHRQLSRRLWKFQHDFIKNISYLSVSSFLSKMFCDPLAVRDRIRVLIYKQQTDAWYKLSQMLDKKQQKLNVFKNNVSAVAFWTNTKTSLL